VEGTLCAKKYLEIKKLVFIFVYDTSNGVLIERLEFFFFCCVEKTLKQR